MSSYWQMFEEADIAARQAHAARITAVARLLDTYPADLVAAMICSRRQESIATARAWIREACDLRQRPNLADASERGELSGDQVTALRVIAEPGSDGIWVETLASDLGCQDFRINELQRLARRKIASQLERADGGRYLKMAPTPDERFVRGRFQLQPEEAAALEQQLDARVPTNTKRADLPTAHADALMQLVTAAGGSGGGGGRDGGGGDTGVGGRDGSGGGRSGRAGVRATVVIRSDPHVLNGTSNEPGELPNGTFIPAHVVRQIADDGNVTALDLSDVNLDTKRIPEPVRRWVSHRDHGRCRGIDCVTPAYDLEQHHLDHNPLNHHPSNLILLCAICHQIKIHRQGWRITGNAERTVTWIQPDGTVCTPPPIVHRARAPDP